MAVEKLRGVLDAQVGAALLYGVVSFLMNFGNKAVFAHTTFDSVRTILFVQFVFTVASLRALRALGWVKFEDLTISLCRELVVPSVMYCVNVGLALASLSSVSIPVYQVIKRLTPAATVLTARVVLGKRESPWIHASIGVMLVGTVITGMGDLRFDGFAYACGLGSVFSQCLYLLYIQKSGIKHDVLTMMYANSVNCIGILFAQNLVTNDFLRAAQHPEIGSLNLWSHLSVILVLGVLLNYSLFLCTTANSALSTTVVGIVKAVFSTALGFFTFGGQPLTLMLLGGVAFNTLGAVWYMHLRYQEKQAKGASQKPRPEDEEQMLPLAAKRGKDEEDVAAAELPEQEPAARAAVDLAIK